MRKISQFATCYPKTIILITVGLTAFFIHQIMNRLYLEPDITKFLPTDIKSVKANDYYQKNFDYSESLIVGVEAADQGIMTPPVLRAIERMVMALKALKTHKTIQSKLTGKTETIELPIGFDIDDISSISGLEDGILDQETGAVVTGSVIKKLKTEMGVPFTEENEALLPESDEDLRKIIPALKNHVMSDRLFRGNMLSADGKATVVHVPMINKWDYKRRYSSLELETALDPDLLKARFQGKTSFFPYNVYGKTIDGVVYDDAFIARHSDKIARRLKDLLEAYLSPAYPKHPKLKELMTGELTRESFTKIINITNERDFFMNPDLLTSDSFTVKLYDFTTSQIDPLSFENLEFRLPDAKQIYSLLDVWARTREILEKNSIPGINTYVAGQPVMIAVIFKIIDKDLKLLLPIGLLVVLFMLTISFRSFSGVVIPFVTVVLSIIWTFGFMAFTGTPVSPTTSNIPIVLLAIVSAYGIHLLNRYYEDAGKLEDRRKILRRSIQGVGAAIIMAGLTTSAGFISLSSSSMTMIRHYAVFSAFGILVGLFLTLTLSPAILCYWRLPRKKRKVADRDDEAPHGFLEKTLVALSSPVKKYPKIIIACFTVIAVITAAKVKDLQFEGSLIEDFRPDHPMRMSDNFINRYLTGTGEINMLFRFRDRVNLENEWVRDQLHKRSEAFANAWSEVVSGRMSPDDSALIAFAGEMMQVFRQTEPDGEKMERSVALMNDLLNEEYTVEIQDKSDAVSETTASALNALFEESSGADSLAGLADTGTSTSDPAPNAAFSGYSVDQVNGLKDVTQRLGRPESAWEETGKSIVKLRSLKVTSGGMRMVRAWNELQDLFAADVKQPYVLRRLENVREQLFALEDPKVDLGEGMTKPTGFAIGPVDLVRKMYSLFYHDGDLAFKKIPDTRTDRLGDSTMTDRGVIGVALNQAQNSDRDTFSGMISPDLKEFQYSIMIRSMLTEFNAAYIEKINEILAREFPDDNPYIESISIGGQSPVIMEITDLLVDSHASSILQALLFVLIITFFIFRSLTGGVYATIPLVFTILANFGMILALGWKINSGTVTVAAISIGVGVDYTIHFLERFKAQLKQGDAFHLAYVNTIRSSGKGIIINAASVAGGFAVLLLSELAGNRFVGTLMIGNMIYSSLAALTLLPALIFSTKPRFLTKISSSPTPQGRP